MLFSARSSKMLGLLLALVFIVGTAFVLYKRTVYARLSETTRQREQALKRDIDASLPVGTQRSQVEKFLRDHDILFVYYPASADTEAHFATLDAYTRQVPTPIFRCKIHLTFRFDQQDGLQGYQEKYVCSE